MFSKVLIANRGEIACRVARTCRRLGVATVAVYSDADRNAWHVALCDEAYRVGAAAAADSYLKIQNIIEAARAANAEAVHPGYGFLSENAEFAEACEAAGLCFIGPPAAAIRTMGSKSAAKALLEKTGVPLTPGYHGKSQDAASLSKAAADIGYPVLIKAVSGGGGKGMRMVAAKGELATAIEAAKREAAAAFGDDQVLLEKYIQPARHIEVQIFTDSKGNAVHLFERDCSIQRRHQKIVEEAPAAGIDEKQRAALGTAAIEVARAVDYLGAGTVEFIAAADGAFYFMEMNTRLQVEHPVTEMVTGQDLVEWQLRVAAGEPLPLRQDQLRLSGHAIEARIYAEDPGRGFLPATGTIEQLREPPTGDGLRIDGAVRGGDSVGVHYDPMIAKLIVHGDNRRQAVHRLRAGLVEYRLLGLTTNVEFLRRLTALNEFANAAIDTGFIETHQSRLLGPRPSVAGEVLALAALSELSEMREMHAAAQSEAVAQDRQSPWLATDGWRLNGTSDISVYLARDAHRYAISVTVCDDEYRIGLPQGSLQVRLVDADDRRLTIECAGRMIRAEVVRQAGGFTLLVNGTEHEFRRYDPVEADSGDSDGAAHLRAPMPGTVIQVEVEPGATVRRGETLLIIEAMKMEHAITAPQDGTVERVHFGAGEQVEEGAELLVMAE